MEDGQKTRVVISVFAGFVFCVLAIFLFVDAAFKASFGTFYAHAYTFYILYILATAIIGLGFFLYAVYESQENFTNRVVLGTAVLLFFLILIVVLLTL